MDQVDRCKTYGLWETRQHLREAQEYLRIGVNMRRIPLNMLYGDNKTSPAGVAPPEYHLLEVMGLTLTYGPQHQARISAAGFPCTQRLAPPRGHVSLLGPPRRLINSLDPLDTRSPRYHLLDEFPMNFNRDNFV